MRRDEVDAERPMFGFPVSLRHRETVLGIIRSALRIPSAEGRWMVGTRQTSTPTDRNGGA